MNRTDWKSVSFLSCLALSGLTGILSAALIAVFQWASTRVIACSTHIYGFVRLHPLYLPLLIVGVAVIGWGLHTVLSKADTCKGGGIPRSVASIRGVVDVNWLADLVILPLSALCTFLCGVPLGTEGPCVQMGTAVGDGITRLFGGKARRDILTGGATAGFALATGAPVTAILFSAEELHKRLSLRLLAFSTCSVAFARLTMYGLTQLGIGSLALFHAEPPQPLAVSRLFIPLIVGAVCGGSAVLFNGTYHRIDKMISRVLRKVSTKVLFPALFSCTAVCGVLVANAVGTGHTLVDHLFEMPTIWYVLLLVALLRAVLMMIANISGVTGGTFLPTLAFGAIIGCLCAEIFTTWGWIGAEHHLLIVALGMAAFLGAVSHIPVTACVFATEALLGFSHIPAAITAVAIAYMVVKITKTESYADTVIHRMEQTAKA